MMPHHPTTLFLPSNQPPLPSPFLLRAPSPPLRFTRQMVARRGCAGWDGGEATATRAGDDGQAQPRGRGTAARQGRAGRDGGERGTAKRRWRGVDGERIGRRTAARRAQWALELNGPDWHAQSTFVPCSGWQLSTWAGTAPPF
jgi:hypothetical protein